MNKEEKERMVEDLLSEFDFEKVDKVMRLLDWKWCVYGDKQVIPGVYGLITEARRLLFEVLEEDEKEYHSLSCGGLKASWDGEYLELEFILTEWGERRED